MVKNMGFDDMISKALEIGENAKFNVSIDGISEIMTYTQLGTYLITNSSSINTVEINLKS